MRAYETADGDVWCCEECARLAAGILDDGVLPGGMRS
jgi:hypothetical protein